MNSRGANFLPRAFKVSPIAQRLRHRGSCGVFTGRAFSNLQPSPYPNLGDKETAKSNLSKAVLEFDDFIRRRDEFPTSSATPSLALKERVQNACREFCSLVEREGDGKRKGFYAGIQNVSLGDALIAISALAAANFRHPGALRVLSGVIKMADTTELVQMGSVVLCKVAQRLAALRLTDSQVFLRLSEAILACEESGDRERVSPQHAAMALAGFAKADCVPPPALVRHLSERMCAAFSSAGSSSASTSLDDESQQQPAELAELGSGDTADDADFVSLYDGVSSAQSLARLGQFSCAGALLCRLGDTIEKAKEREDHPGVSILDVGSISMVAALLIGLRGGDRGAQSVVRTVEKALELGREAHLVYPQSVIRQQILFAIAVRMRESREATGPRSERGGAGKWKGKEVENGQRLWSGLSLVSLHEVARVLRCIPPEVKQSVSGSRGMKDKWVSGASFPSQFAEEVSQLDTMD
uniref:Uncharacterized protein n=1 Tax=Chromera velia CCMP2878 TaxID=1169474 RepID=A0A0G4HIE6_9ALVE|eukprot:Cvel_27920.t1-p1 / transcript=Cvel_27920.t1 / gene=Cvel_27920 / organism=Chromera_velia_CCMP2878 / gene_product=hypothetical protein / transcript_product=hypothetical protein / location=Cvel_scaffold3557:8253-9659(-) / protein_length=469 / sequence_SO=supercontig / SO=protein_coding / is_pseudo=false